MFHQYNSMAGENERESWDKQEARSAREQGAWSGATGGPQAPKRTAVRNKKRLIRSGCCG